MIIGGGGIIAIPTGRPRPIDWWLADGLIGSGNVMGAYLAKGAASLSASYVNLNDPGTNDITPGVAPTLDADGWVFNGTTQYLIPGLTPAQGWTGIVRFSNRANQGYVFGEVGIDDSTGRFGITPSNGTGVNYQYGSSLPTETPTLDSGVLAIAGPTGYRDGASDTTGMTWSGTPREIHIGARNLGTASNFYQGKIQAIAFYNITLSAAQISALTTAMQVL